MGEGFRVGLQSLERSCPSWRQRVSGVALSPAPRAVAFQPPRPHLLEDLPLGDLDLAEDVAPHPRRLSRRARQGLFAPGREPRRPAWPSRRPRTRRSPRHHDAARSGRTRAPAQRPCWLPRRSAGIPRAWARQGSTLHEFAILRVRSVTESMPARDRSGACLTLPPRAGSGRDFTPKTRFQPPHLALMLGGGAHGALPEPMKSNCAVGSHLCDPGLRRGGGATL
jgi:hypothetical protein